LGGGGADLRSISAGVHRFDEGGEQPIGREFVARRAVERSERGQLVGWDSSCAPARLQTKEAAEKGFSVLPGSYDRRSSVELAQLRRMGREEADSVVVGCDEVSQLEPVSGASEFRLGEA